MARRKLSIIWDIANPSPGVMAPRPTAPETTFIAPKMSVALLIAKSQFNRPSAARRDGAIET